MIIDVHIPEGKSAETLYSWASSASFCAAGPRSPERSRCKNLVFLHQNEKWIEMVIQMQTKMDLNLGLFPTQIRILTQTNMGISWNQPPLAKISKIFARIEGMSAG